MGRERGSEILRQLPRDITPRGGRPQLQGTAAGPCVGWILCRGRRHVVTQCNTVGTDDGPEIQEDSGQPALPKFTNFPGGRAVGMAVLGLEVANGKAPWVYCSVVRGSAVVVP